MAVLDAADLSAGPIAEARKMCTVVGSFCSTSHPHFMGMHLLPSIHVCGEVYRRQHGKLA